MEASKRRLYVGGIGPTVTETELKERFGKFGNVDGVDLISRKDEQGNPVKTFAYLNINISEADLKKCMSVLNKTKWKGGMLQIEMAKESFLHRLSQERQEATEKKPGAQPQRDLVQSLKDSGVTEFQMKAAVPGTEVPNHKDWVVSKYGRVLPVLHLKANNKSKVIKYDPSKYCHNIKKLEAGSCEAVPVSQLTWHLEGGDDEISKKRRGEFPSPKNPVQKKLKLEKRLDTSETGSPRKFNRKDSLSSDCVSASASGGRQVKTPSGLKAVNGHLVKRNRKNFSDGESDSEEELKAILEREKKARQEGMIPTDDANLEVVADSFELSYTTHWDCKNKSNTKKGSTKDKDDSEYDSADTDEIISVTKTVQKEKSINMEMQKGPLEKKKLKKETIVKGKFINMEMPKGTKDDSEYDSADTDEIIAVTKNVHKDKGINMDMRKGTLEKNKPHILTKKETSQKGKVINMEMLEGTKYDSEYDSADTDEIIAVTKTVQKDKGINMDMRKGTLEKNKSHILTKKETSQKGKVINMEMLEGTKDDSENDSADTDEIIAVTKAVQKEKTINNERQKGTLEKEKPHVLPKKLKKTVEDKDSRTSIGPEHGELDSQSGEENSDSESSDSCSDEEYNSMMQNCYRLDLTMGDLEKLANSAKESSEEETNDKKSDSDQGELENSKVQTPVTKDRKRTGIDPEDIVASILQDEDDDDDRSDKRSKQKRNNVPPAVFPEFKGLGSLLGKTQLEKGEVSMNTLSTPKTTKSLAQGAAKGTKSSSVKSSSDVSKKEKEHEPGSKGVSDSKVGHKQVSSQPKANKQKEEDSSYSSDNDTSSVESSSEDEASNAPSAAALHNVKKGTKAQTDAGKKHLVEQPTPRTQQRGGDKQLQDNKKRLAAMEERRKERELQKKTIQGALLKSDAKISSKGQHIVFGSESESEHEKMEAEASDASQSSDAASKNNETVPGPNVTAKLFESSEDSDDNEENDDQGRFQIKSQYEGASGEKLMQLQSRFGTDERFRMDSRFLDNSSEDEVDKAETAPNTQEDADDLLAEKKKNLGILQSLLNINVESQPVNKQTMRAKQFKDLNALQYDPTREDHSTFEAEDEKKESKSKRKKKRLEAEKLPEVSRDTYHEVTVDLKQVFGTSKAAQESEVTGKSWDQEEESETTGEQSSATQGTFSFQSQDEEPTGFTFSFFGDVEGENESKAVPYKIETIRPAKVVWQEDPRFQDSSSSEEEVDKEDETKQRAESKTSLKSKSATSNIRFFFFVKDDERLKMGPKIFFRSSNLEKEQEAWEQRRELLLEECRKKHKDAKRKLKYKH